MLLLVLLSVGCLKPSGDTEVVQAPAFELPDLTGGKVALSSLKDKVVVLDFWATWCGPCLFELPHYAEFWKKNHGRGVEVVGVACDSEPQEVLDMSRERQIPYRLLMSDGKVQDAYGAEGLPTTFVIDQRGYVRKKFLGAEPKKFEKLQETVDALLAAK